MGWVHPSTTIFPTCADVEKRLTFSEKVGMNDELVRISVTEGEKKKGGKREES